MIPQKCITAIGRRPGHWDQEEDGKEDRLSSRGHLCWENCWWDELSVAALDHFVIKTDDNSMCLNFTLFHM